MESDQELADRASRADRLAFRDLVERYQRVVFGFCFHLTGDLESAHRLAREALVEAYLEGVRADAPGAWVEGVERIAGRLFRQRRHEKSSSIVTEQEDASAAAPRASGTGLPPETLTSIAEDLHAIDAFDRITLALRHGDGRTPEEIGAFTGEAPATIHSRQSRGFKAVRDLLLARMREGRMSVGV